MGNLHKVYKKKIKCWWIIKQNLFAFLPVVSLSYSSLVAYGALFQKILFFYYFFSRKYCILVAVYYIINLLTTQTTYL
ncbi:hypothetical protein C6H68_03185 [Photorhabdus luminescens]|nr:hypothetical protein C6H68_03185 [Photorhabdus luminescens]